MAKYLVVADSFLTSLSPAVLVKSEGYKNRYKVVAEGSLEQMEELCEELNGNTPA